MDEQQLLQQVLNQNQNTSQTSSSPSSQSSSQVQVQTQPQQQPAPQNLPESLEKFLDTEEKIALIEKLEGYSNKLERIINLLSKYISFNKDKYSDKELMFIQSAINNLSSIKTLIDDFLKIAPIYDLDTIKNFYFIISQLINSTFSPILSSNSSNKKTTDGGK